MPRTPPIHKSIVPAPAHTQLSAGGVAHLRRLCIIRGALNSGQLPLSRFAAIASAVLLTALLSQHRAAINGQAHRATGCSFRLLARGRRHCSDARRHGKGRLERLQRSALPLTLARRDLRGLALCACTGCVRLLHATAGCAAEMVSRASQLPDALTSNK